MLRVLPPLLFALSLAACTVAAPPVWLVPSDRPLAPAELTGRAARALRQAGWSIELVDRDLGVVMTDWDYGEEILGSTRRRAMVRVPADAANALAVSVPVEYFDGTCWQPNGEDEERRKFLVATLRARMATR